MPPLFTSLFQDKLREELSKRIKDYEVIKHERWLSIKGNQVIPVDIVLESDDRLVLIEIESHRADPSKIVAKIPYCLEHNITKKKVVMIQLFSAYYDRHKIKQAKFAEHLGDLVMEKYAGFFVYKAISMKMSYEDFERVYSKPRENEAMLNVIAEENAERIVDWLTENQTTFNI